MSVQKRQKLSSIACPYLDTVDRNRLDFDFEKMCSVSLSPINVYACLVCGKYFQGRGPSSHAYFHSVNESHHVYMNMTSLRIFCLPDNYEIIDSSLSDIQQVAQPKYHQKDVDELDLHLKQLVDLSLVKYYPGLFVDLIPQLAFIEGFIGMNNIKASDYANVVLQALTHVIPIRNYFLLNTDFHSELVIKVKRFGLLTRKIWNSKAFRAHVSPHELLQYVTTISGKKFSVLKQGDAFDFMIWLLNYLHKELGGTRKSGSSIIYQNFQGELEMTIQKLDEKGRIIEEEGVQTKRVPFLFLSLDLPPMPLYADDVDTNVIPQVTMDTLLEKYDGTTTQIVGSELRTYKVTKFPKYLLFHMKRFGQNNWTVEKNTTIVNYNVRDLKILPEDKTKYNLIANIVHDGKLETGNYRAQILHSESQQWFEIQDLEVKKVAETTIFLSEAYMQIWEAAK